MILPLISKSSSGTGTPQIYPQRDIHADFAQRISVHYHIHPLTKTQTAAYIDFHLKSSGASDKIFDSDVKDLIHEFSAGIPRQINAISTACLINASIRQSQKITRISSIRLLLKFNLFRRSTMACLFPQLLRSLTKRYPIDRLIADVLSIPHKYSKAISASSASLF
ncbi:MAG: hypothetical protein HS127_16800 [Planctomycetia bacterium]|nr:hypothetical protein [Planctomycetia bacterium]